MGIPLAHTLREVLDHINRLASDMLPGGQYLNPGDVKMTVIPHPIPEVFNRVYDASFADTLRARRIDDIVQYFDRHRRGFVWTVSTIDPVGDLEASLGRRGFRPIDRALAMGAPLGAFGRLRASTLEIRKVESRHDLAIFCDVLCRGYPLPSMLAPIFQMIYDGVGFDSRAIVQHFVGWHGGQPVTAASVMWGPGLAVIFNVATVVAERGRGFAKAMTTYVLDMAVSRGYSAAGLTATEMGEPIYRKLGFVPLYSLEHWLAPSHTGGLPA